MLGHLIDDSSAEVTCGEVSLGHTHSRVPVVHTHAHFRLHDLRQNGSECFLKSIRLLFEKLVTLFNTNSFGFVKLQIPKRNGMKIDCSTYILEGKT